MIDTKRPHLYKSGRKSYVLSFGETTFDVRSRSKVTHRWSQCKTLYARIWHFSGDTKNFLIFRFLGSGEYFFSKLCQIGHSMKLKTNRSNIWIESILIPLYSAYKVLHWHFGKQYILNQRSIVLWNKGKPSLIDRHAPFAYS